ncbi:MAG: penicillin-binding protein 1A [Thiotrichales bacterium]|jgi:penicillin-binding protein 1A|nr:penicillin-binding protein 1A [Thiotrichales bacterium]
MERILPPNNKNTTHAPRDKKHSLFDDEFVMSEMHDVDTAPVTHKKVANEKPQRAPRTWIKITLWSGLIVTIIGTALVAFAAFNYWTNVYPTLPSVSELKTIQMQVPLRIYTADNKLIAEYGEKKRIPLSYEQFPPQMIQAILAAEDDRFFEHPGVDYQGIVRAAIELVRTGHKSQGGSTITMQVARNFFLSPEKSFMRKINEIVLSLKIESELSKEEIIALYLNKIFLGHRSYGFAAAAQTYFGRSLDQLTLDEFAILAGLPKAPSTLNPVTNPEAAKNRRDYVLRRMTELGYITEEMRLEAQAKPIESEVHTATIEAHAEHVAEMVRQWAVERYGDTALEQGLKITTTLRADLQTQAQTAINTGVLAYERRHGYRGPVAVLDVVGQQQWPVSVKDIYEPDAIKLALITNWDDKTKLANAKLKDGTLITLDAKASEWARNYKEPKRKSYLQIGDVIYVEPVDNQNYRLAQEPRIQAALASVDSKTGAILALSGGYDASRNQFNHATQARRQPGSSFKPFLYTAALDKGYTPATIINDAPISQYDEYSEDYWRPENYTGKFGGPTRMRVALIHSLNLVSIRIMQDIGIDYFLAYAKGLGLDTKEMESIHNLSIALGTASTTVLEHVGNYTMFSNGGYRVPPYLIEKVTDAKDAVLFQAAPPRLCDTDCGENTAPRVIKPTTHYLVTNMMQDVVRMGTGHGAMVLKRNDLAGKTGTTNDMKDTWFMGFNPDIVTGVWMGFDQPVNMGKQESGGTSALPIWVDYMRLALKNKPDIGFAKPEGIVSRRIDATTGALLTDDTPGGISEVFDQDNLPAVATPDPLRELQHELF